MLAQLAAWLRVNVAEVAALEGVKVHVVQAEQGTLTDHVVVEKHGEDPHNHLGGVGGLKSATVDIDCKAQTPDAAEALALAIERDLEPYTGAMGSITVDAVILNDTSDWSEAAKPGRDVDRYVTTKEFTIQYKVSS